MSELKPRITENGIDYILVGDYYIPDLKLPEEHRPIGKYGRMHREYLREVCPARLHTLTLTGELWTYARGGYDVIVDGIIGPWFLKPWQSLVREHYEVHYIILRASKEETLKRAVERSKLDRKTNIELVETMWEQFCNLGIYESNVIDTTTYSSFTSGQLVPNFYN